MARSGDSRARKSASRHGGPRCRKQARHEHAVRRISFLGPILDRASSEAPILTSTSEFQFRQSHQQCAPLMFEVMRHVYGASSVGWPRQVSGSA